MGEVVAMFCYLFVVVFISFTVTVAVTVEVAATETAMERGLHESCLISPGAKMGNRAEAMPTPSHTHNAHMSPHFVFSYFCLTICHCLSGLSGR